MNYDIDFKQINELEKRVSISIDGIFSSYDLTQYDILNIRCKFFDIISKKQLHTKDYTDFCTCIRSAFNIFTSECYYNKHNDSIKLQVNFVIVEIRFK